jgi:hypothetical protein
MFTIELDAGKTTAQLQVVDIDHSHVCGHDRVAEIYLFFCCVNIYMETCVKQHIYCAYGPCLRGAGNGVVGGSLSASAGKPAEQLGEALELQEHGGVEKAGSELQGLSIKAVPGTAPCDHRHIVGPYRSVMIGHGIVALLPRAEGADSPSGKHIRLEQLAGYALRLVLVRNPRKKAVSRIRGTHTAGAFLNRFFSVAASASRVAARTSSPRTRARAAACIFAS